MILTKHGIYCMSHTVCDIQYESYSERYLKFNNTNDVPTLIICQTRLGDYIAKFNDKIKVSDDPSANWSIYHLGLLKVSQTLHQSTGYLCQRWPKWANVWQNRPKFDIRNSILHKLTFIVSYVSIWLVQTRVNNVTNVIGVMANLQ